MKDGVFIFLLLVLCSQTALAVIMTEAPRNRAVAFKKQFTCTHGTWKQVVRQVTNNKGISERYVGFKCVPSKKITR